jgi:alpha/beta superfamily hydrolase
MIWEKIKLGLFSAAGGAIVLAIVGFSWGGWVTGGTAKRMAEEVASEAIVARLTPICVTQFNRDPGKDQKLKELQETSSWQRKSYVEKQGWATMPDGNEPDDGVAVECANRIIQVSQSQ